MLVTLMEGSAVTTATIEKTKIMIPKTLHLSFFIPISPKIPARSIRIPTAAEIIAETLSASTA